MLRCSFYVRRFNARESNDNQRDAALSQQHAVADERLTFADSGMTHEGRSCSCVRYSTVCMHVTRSRGPTVATASYIVWDDIG